MAFARTTSPVIAAKFVGRCGKCGSRYAEGTPIFRPAGAPKWWHASCRNGHTQPAPINTPIEEIEQHTPEIEEETQPTATVVEQPVAPQIEEQAIVIDDVYTRRQAIALVRSAIETLEAKAA